MSRSARDGRFGGLLQSALTICCVAGCAAIVHARTLYVRAGAAPGGNGSRPAPFDSLATVEKASAPGDVIVVMPAPSDVPPLDGGIALKPDQSLIGGGPPVNGAGPLAQAPRITNSDPHSNSGDAVVLADHVAVGNLVITRSYRGGIYGANVTGVRIYGNNLSATNTACAAGLYVYFPGDVPVLANGWATIMIDESRGAGWVSVEDNYIHDGKCSDGIDILATGDAQVQARVSGNRLTRLAQGPRMRSVLAIGMQTRDHAVLSVDSDDDSETYIGSPEADCEGLFGNQTGGSLTWSIDHNTFAHGIGGGSCNGAEFFTDTGLTTTNLYIEHSTFAYDPGDMIEEDNAGDTGSVMNLTMVDVAVSHTSFPTKLPPEPKFTDIQYMDNLGRCMDQYSWGHRVVNNLRVIDSSFTDCYGDGIGSDVTGGTFVYKDTTAVGAKLDGMNFGDAAGDSVSIEVQDSSIEDSGQYALHFANHAAMSDLLVRVEDSRLSAAKGAAIVAFDQNGTTRHSHIVLGGKGVRANCILGGARLAAEASGYDVSAQWNWWGRPQGPTRGRISATHGQLRIDPVRRSAPPSCAAGR